MLTTAQFRTYFESRLQGQRFTSRAEVKLKCPFHEDRNPSLSVNLEKGIWKCHAGCGDGGLIDFEMKFSRCDRETAKANTAELLGENRLFSAAQKEAVYAYQDARGRLVFEKLRMPGKRFVIRQPDAKGGWVYKLSEGPKPLYHLPEVLVANYAIITEGEKDADNVRALNLSNHNKDWFVAATTNFDGAGKWRDEYAVFFAGKLVVVLPDNDEAGCKHAEQVATSVSRYAAGVKIVLLPGLPEKGDVSDYLQSGHTAEELLEEIKKAPQWRPAGPDQPKLLVPITNFSTFASEEIDWMVEGIIERGANGAIVAEPKIGKSWLATELLICLALGTDFLGFKVPRPVKVALVSREDNPPLTAWRIRHLFASKCAENPNLFESNGWINTRKQSKQLLLDNDEQFGELLADLRIVKPEFVILDVLNTLHTKDENDATDMRQVFARLDEIQREIGCGIAIVHHFGKSGTERSITQRMRGSSAIAGWCEWMIGIELEDSEQKVRRMHFELKAAAPPEPMFWVITTGPGVAELKIVPQPEKATGHEKARGRVQ